MNLAIEPDTSVLELGALRIDRQSEKELLDGFSLPTQFDVVHGRYLLFLWATQKSIIPKDMPFGTQA
jgi:hypothetical protein